MGAYNKAYENKQKNCFPEYCICVFLKTQLFEGSMAFHYPIFFAKWTIAQSYKNMFM